MKRVEIKGFKSIARKTSLTIADGITCIAGPNGCGKSNIIDAVRWSLGEQSNRSLRAGSMNDVIFSGTQDTGPSSMAEVTLEFVRDSGYFPKVLDGFEEVSITRKLFGTGESIYSLNSVKCRLKDITDLFLDTGLDRHGYAIIEQGKVKDIIQSRPEDIRYLIEEAAEVGKFRIKRLDAVKRLEATALNLDRIKDLLSEVSRQRDDLKSQANKARKYQSVRLEINETTKILWAYEIGKIKEKKAGLGSEGVGINGRFVAFKRQHEEYVQVLKEHEAKVSLIRQKIEEARREVGEAQSRETLALREIEGSENRKQDISSTLGMLQSRIEQMERTRQDLLNKQEQGTKELENLLQEISRLKEEMNSRSGHLETARTEYQKLENEYSQGRAGLFDAIGHARAMDQRTASMETRSREIVSNAEKRGNDLAELAEKRAALKERLDSLDAELALKKAGKDDLDALIHTLSERIHELQAEAEARSHEVVGLEKTHTHLLAKLSMLERIIKSSTMAIPPDLSRLNGSKRVADALKVKAGFEETVGRSMGSTLDYLIVHDHKEILEYEALQDGGPGYIPKKPHVDNGVTKQHPKGKGVIAPLSELVEAHEGYEDVIHALSRDMVVVEDIHCAVLLWNEGMRSCSLVAKDGTILEPTGVVRTTAAMEKYAEGLKAKAEKEDTERQKSALEQDIAGRSERLHGVKVELQRLKQEIEGAREKDRELKAQIDALMEKRHGEAREMDRFSEREISFRRDVEMWNDMAKKLNEDLSSLALDKEKLEGRIEMMQEEMRSLDTGRLSAKQALDHAQSAIGAHATRMGALKVLISSKQEMLQAVEEQSEGISREILRDEAKMGELQSTRDAVLDILEKAKSGLARAREETVKGSELLKELMPEYDEVTENLNTLTQSRQECRENLEMLEKARNEVTLKAREQEIALSMGLERFNSRFAKELLPSVPDCFNPDDAREKVEKAGDRIEKMGQINFASLDAYEQVQGRWDDLHRQYEDVVQASTRLKEVIAGIEQQSMKAFLATFELIKTYFQELFTAMFGGGKADLVLAEGNPLEAGVEILACPPFKKLKSMSLLSEGEKTLCALSFIFALFKVKPSPFCILDEVDAPLDDANVIRFNRLIRSFSSASQFIMVTHNRHTMEMADVLYGVTFDVPGVSKVVSMVLQDAEGINSSQF